VIALHLVPLLGPVRIARLVSTFGSARGAWHAGETALAAVPGIGPRIASHIVRSRPAVDVDVALRRAGEAGARVATWWDSGYPERLRELDDAPPVVYLRGRWEGTAGPAAAIVGTRRPSPYGVNVARTLGEALGRAGAVVVSGLARGIDRAAHEGALREDGMTVAVLGCGIDVVYPPEHRSLIEAMLARGGVVSEVPIGMRPRPQQFPPRNRLISALAQAVVVVEGGVDSGSLITARHAAVQGRPVYAVPGSVFSAASRGPHHLLVRGARLLQDPGPLLEAVGLAWRPGTSGPAAGLTDTETRVFAVLDEQPEQIDRIIARAALDAGCVAAALATLELRGLVRQCPGKRFARWSVFEGSNRPHRAGGVPWSNHSLS